MRFTLHCVAGDGSKKTLYYDNQTSALEDEDGQSMVPVTLGAAGVQAFSMSAANPARKTSPRTLKISLGLSCNYECSYCSQRFVPHAEQTNPDSIEPFLAQLRENLTAPPQRIEFWGGEPFVYWKTMKPLAERLREMYPNVGFGIVTNGSLLDEEKIDWLDRMGFGVGISHDGPGYHVRGADPLDDPEKRAAIMSLYARFKPQGRVSINSMIHSGNQSRAEVQAWLRERFGNDVIIGEGAFIDPYDEGGLASTLQSAAEHIAFRSQALHEIRVSALTSFSVTKDKLRDFSRSILTGRRAETLGQKCGMDKADKLAVDLHGNVLTCQNVSAVSTAPNGRSNKIGELSKLSEVRLDTSTHWSNRKDCPSCPVLQLCKGACMFLEGPLWDSGCDAAFSDNLPFFVAAIEHMTGYAPTYIDGDFRTDRKDIFGAVNGVPKSDKPRVIPIHTHQN